MKAINWTATAALARTLLILGAASFFGALVLPTGANGALPLTWVAWKPIVASALGASIATEIAWIRLHLSQAAAAVGAGAAPPTATPLAKAAGAAVVLLGLGGLLRGVTACSVPPQTVADISVGVQAAACVLDTYATDLQSGKSETQAIADSALKCGVSAAQASGLLAEHRKAAIAQGCALRPAADAGQ